MYTDMPLLVNHLVPQAVNFTLAVIVGADEAKQCVLWDTRPVSQLEVTRLEATKRVVPSRRPHI
jgi:hypothetical protein